MSNFSFSELPEFFATKSHDLLRRHFWREFHQRPHKVVPVKLAEGARAFWSTVVSAAGQVGPNPIALVPFSPLGQKIREATKPYLNGPAGMEGFEIAREQNVESGAGFGYMGTINGIRVYTADIADEAILCSRNSVDRITYGIVWPPDQLVDISFDDAESTTCAANLTFQQIVSWAEFQYVKFTFMEPKGLAAP